MLKVSFLILAAACSLPAAPITWTFAGALSGSLNGTAFTGAQTIVTLTGDTSAAVVDADGLLINPASSATLSIAGFGAGEFTESILAFASPLQFLDWAYAGFLPADRRQNTGLNIRDPAFIDWNLSSPLGPVPAIVNFTGGDFATTLGDLDLVPDNVGQTIIFQATVVPEPGTGVAAGIGLLTIVCCLAGRIPRSRSHSGSGRH